MFLRHVSLVSPVAFYDGHLTMFLHLLSLVFAEIQFIIDECFCRRFFFCSSNGNIESHPYFFLHLSRRLPLNKLCFFYGAISRFKNCFFGVFSGYLRTVFSPSAPRQVSFVGSFVIFKTNHCSGPAFCCRFSPIILWKSILFLRFYRFNLRLSSVFRRLSSII